MFSDLQDFLAVLRRERELIEITAPVDPYLEAAEIHRRVIAQGGPALLFRNITSASFPLVTNLWGTKRRIELSFGARPENLIRDVARLPEELMPPSIGRLWSKRGVLGSLLALGTKETRSAPVCEVVESPPQLMRLPLLTTWAEDGGPFITLPLVYTQHPKSAVHNLGIYRLQRFDGECTGFHCQIGKGAGFHLAAARENGLALPVNVHIGGPPALTLAAIAPLPENVPELLLASLVQGKRVRMCKNPLGQLPLIGSAEFILVGEVAPEEMRPEGPFGDHYGYYSLKHEYPVFRCKGLLRRNNPIFTATVVGKPRQEDFFLGDYIQELLSPVFPLVMPAVENLWAYGETGYHSLASAVVKQRYKREAMMSAFRILGEGQLSLTKFLLVLDARIDLRNFKSVLEHVLERADFRTDLYVFSNLAMDTLDYTGPKVNEGSKGVLLGVGAPIRSLPGEFSGKLPLNIKEAVPFCRGCLVISGDKHPRGDFASELLRHSAFSQWPLVIFVDDARAATKDVMSFLWTAFTRFEPGADIYAAEKSIVRNHVSYSPPILMDARMKPGYPAELNCDEKTSALVTKRWKEYFPREVLQSPGLNSPEP